jgi:hypothetical protein
MPPLVYRYKTWALVNFAYFGLACATIFPISIYNAIFIRVPIVIILSILLAAFTGFMAWVSISFLLLRLGARIEIRDGKLLAINRDGKVRVEGFVSDIVELRSLYLKPNDVPMEFMVVFAGNRKLRFESQIENLAELKSTLEFRSGKQFVSMPRNKV